MRYILRGVKSSGGVDAQGGQQGLEFQLGQGMQADLFHPDRMGLGEFEGADIDLDEYRSGGGCGPGDELRRDGLGAALDRLGEVQGEQCGLAAEQLQ